MRFIAMFITAVCVLFLKSYGGQRKRVFTILFKIFKTIILNLGKIRIVLFLLFNFHILAHRQASIGTTSFPGSSLFLPREILSRGMKSEDPGNEVGIGKANRDYDVTHCANCASMRQKYGKRVLL